MIDDLGHRVGLIGDAHGDILMLMEAARALRNAGADTLVQLGDFGLIFDARWRKLVATLDEALSALGIDMYVVLGNHENYDAIDALARDEHGVVNLGRIHLLPAADGHPVGWLRGAASIDVDQRVSGQTWWAQEIPTEDEAAGLSGGEPVEVVFAHDALDSPTLKRRLATTRHLWTPSSLAYAEEQTRVFTTRALPHLADGGVVVSGHYHFNLTDESVFDGRRARSEILNMEWEPGSIAVLDMDTLGLERMSLAAPTTQREYAELRLAWNDFIIRGGGTWVG